MSALRSLRRPFLLALTTLAPLVIACGDSTEPSNDLVGTWNATSLLVAGVDLTDQGMTLSFTFGANGSYSYTVTNDLIDFCSPGPACTDSGNYVVSGNQITFDPGVDEATVTYSISGSTLTVNGTIDAINFTFTFAKQ